MATAVLALLEPAVAVVAQTLLRRTQPELVEGRLLVHQTGLVPQVPPVALGHMAVQGPQQGMLWRRTEQRREWVFRARAAVVVVGAQSLQERLVAYVAEEMEPLAPHLRKPDAQIVAVVVVVVATALKPEPLVGLDMYSWSGANNGCLCTNRRKRT